ncbi:hypothetical protein BH23VER1_BH23VER1_00680 [soil metagenome]
MLTPSVADSSDTDLLRRFAEGGDEEAFQELVARYGGLVSGVARRHTGDLGLAEEVAQTVFVAVAKKARRLADGRPLAAWLHRAALLEALKSRRKSGIYQRKLQRYQQHRELDASTTAPDAWDGVRTQVDAALDRLPRLDRDVLLLHFLEGKPFRAVAAAIGTSPEAAQKRGTRALAKLSRQLQARGVTLSVASLVSALGAGFADGASLAWKSSLASTVTSGASGAAGAATASAAAGTALACGLFAASAAIPIGIEMATAPVGSPPVAAAAPAPVPAGPARPAVPPFDLGLVREAIAYLENSADHDAAAERALRRLIFGLDLDQIQAVASLVAGTGRKERLYEVALACYARWAELDPPGAMAAANALTPGQLGYYPLRGAFFTWAQIDREGALAWLGSATSEFDLRFLGYEMITRTGKADAVDALELADRIGTARPDWYETLFQRAAHLWVARDPDAALAHLATLPDAQRGDLLAKGLESLGESDPVAALERVGILTTAAQQDSVSHEIYWNWATRDPLRAFEYFAAEDRLPTWPPNLLRAAAEAVARHDPAIPLGVVGQIIDPERRDRFLGGILAGSTWSDPSATVAAAELISDSASYQIGDIGQFVEGWAGQDFAAAEAWVTALPDSEKKLFATGGLGRAREALGNP